MDILWRAFCVNDLVEFSCVPIYENEVYPMNTIYEIPVQNQQDFWSALYMYVGKSIMDICGRHGEAAIRDALYGIAEEEGTMFLEACRVQGIKPNVHTLYELGCGCSGDPRMRIEVLNDEEQERLWNVYTCPLSDLWRDAGERYLGNLYCEENQLGLIHAFTQGKGQFHLGKKLLCHRDNGCRPDNHCGMSVYYRAANVDYEQCTACFSMEGKPTVEKLAPLETQSERLTRKTVQLVCRIAASAQKFFGNEGLCAVALGLRALVKPTADMLFHDAKMTLCDDLALFAEQNLPLNLDVEEDPTWEKYGDAQGRSLFAVNFALPLKKILNL